MQTNKSELSLLAHIATQVWDVDLEIRHTCNFVATIVKLSRICFNIHIFIHSQF